MKIKIEIDGASGYVPRAGYVKDTLRRLQEFGYPTLTSNEVDDAVTAALEGGVKADVISMFVAGEVCPTHPDQPNTNE